MTRIAHFFTYTTTTCINAYAVNEVIEYFQNKHDNLISDEKVHIERQKTNVYIAISFSTHEENWETVVEETFSKLLDMYRMMHPNYDSGWTFSTLKSDDYIIDLESIHCILKYEIYKRFANPDVYKLDNNKYHDLCGTITKNDLDINELEKLAIEKQPCKLMIIRNCFNKNQIILRCIWF
ncbi:hypothetical protein COBT_001731 [Conglomerata obtusa]